MTKVKDIILVPLEPFDLECIRQLQGVTFQAGSFDKRFCYGMALYLTKPDSPFSQKQQRLLRYMVHRYRRQIRGHKCTQWCENPYKTTRIPSEDDKQRLAEWNRRVRENNEQT